MATDNYKIATVNPNTRFGFTDAVNGLAISTDAALQDVYESIHDTDYELPVATGSRLGGVVVGDGLTIYKNGLLEAENTEYTLTAATASKLGGISVGKNIDVTSTGKISLGEGAIASNQVSSAQLARGSVTTAKIATGSVTEAKLGTGIMDSLNGVSNVSTGSPTVLVSYTYAGSAHPRFIAYIQNNIAIVGKTGGFFYKYAGTITNNYFRSNGVRPFADSDLDRPYFTANLNNATIAPANLMANTLYTCGAKSDTTIDLSSLKGFNDFTIPEKFFDINGNWVANVSWYVSPDSDLIQMSFSGTNPFNTYESSNELMLNCASFAVTNRKA